MESQSAKLLIASPEQPYTNKAQIELAVTIPQEAVGDTSAKVRIYLALAGLDPAAVVDVPVGTTSQLTVPFELTKGQNDITATLFRGSEESEPSPVITYVLDQEGFLLPPEKAEKLDDGRDGRALSLT